MISRYRIARTIKAKLAVLSVAVACIAGVWASTASAATTPSASPVCSLGATGYWTGYWTWNPTTRSWFWTWTWYVC